MKSYILAMAIIGFSALAMAWIPEWLKNKAFSYPIIFLLFGMLLYSLPVGLPIPDINKHEGIILRLTELIVIITLMGTGLKINRRFSLKNWRTSFMLVTVTMLLCIAGLAFLSWYWLGFSLAGAILLGGALAPTDPVLAGNVQVGIPGTKTEDPVRFSLTAEAGMNDGMAFPFIWLAIVVGSSSGTFSSWFTGWLLQDLLFRVLAGVATGLILGYAIAYLVFSVSGRKSFPKINDGFVALSSTFLVYGITELLHGYGFIAVFVAAITLRNFELHHKLHRELHDFIDQTERFLMVILLIPFGGILVNGLLDNLSWMGAMAGLIFIFIIRPVSGLAGLLGEKMSVRDKFAISFFGIRGIGSFFYLAFGLYHAHIMEAEELWSIIGFTVLISIVLHGILAGPVMNYLDLKGKRVKDDAFKSSTL